MKNTHTHTQHKSTLTKMIEEESGNPLTDHDTLLSQLHHEWAAKTDNSTERFFATPDWQARASAELIRARDDLSAQKRQSRVRHEEYRARQKAQHLAFVRHQKDRHPVPMVHPTPFSFSIKCDRVTRPPYNEESSSSSQRKNEDLSNKPNKQRQSPAKIIIPWYPTALRGKEFPMAEMGETLTQEYLKLAQAQVRTNIRLCEQDLASLVSTTQDGLKERQKCTQALREFNVILDKISSSLE